MLSLLVPPTRFWPRLKFWTRISLHILQPSSFPHPLIKSLVVHVSLVLILGNYASNHLSNNSWIMRYRLGDDLEILHCQIWGGCTSYTWSVTNPNILQVFFIGRPAGYLTHATTKGVLNSRNCSPQYTSLTRYTLG
jgi:hypothetical protein